MRIAAWSLLVFAIVLTLGAAGPAGAQSVGFYPSVIELENGLRGQRYESTTTLVNQTAEPHVFTLAARGQTADWTTFASMENPDTPIDEVSVPPATEIEILVTIAIPESVPNGEVSGLNAYDGYTEQALRDREGVVTGFEQPVRIRVTGDQVIDLRVGDVSAANVEAGQPLRIKTQLTNNGNVDTAPELIVDFFQLPLDPEDDQSVDSLGTALEAVRPGKSATLETEWQTEGHEPGRYRADYTLEHEGERLALGSFEFELMPAGSLARTGTIMSIDVIRPVSPNAINRADVTFVNTGEIDSLARFDGHVLKDGVAFTAAESPDSLLVRPGEQVMLSAFFQLPAGADGDYEIRGRVYFEGAQTDEVTAMFRVAGSGERSIVTVMAVGGALAVAVGSALVGGAWLSRRNR